MAQTSRDAVTVLGLGAMGRALAGAFVDAGHPTTVWNRTPGKTGDLVARGAREASTLADAVRAAPLVVVSLVDQAASQALLEPLGPALRGRSLVDLSSDTPERARRAAVWAADHGIAYLDGAVMVPAPLVGSSDAVILVSGPAEVFAAQRATLEALGGQVHHLGADPGAAALHDVAMLDVFYSAMAGTVHAFALVGTEDVAARDFEPFVQQIFGILPPIVTSIAAAVDTGDHPGELDRLDMEAAALGHIVVASQTRGLDTGVLRAVQALADRAVAAGHGGSSFSGILHAVREPLSTG